MIQYNTLVELHRLNERTGKYQLEQKMFIKYLDYANESWLEKEAD